MGVSGCGKSTVGRNLADEIDAVFYDGDDLHPASNIHKMARGSSLTDKDRLPWLETIVKTITENPQDTVVACSALKKSYRDVLRKAGNVTFIYLEGSKETLLKRLKSRSKQGAHFMPISLLESQLDTLESPNTELDTIISSIEDPINTILTNILYKLATIKQINPANSILIPRQKTHEHHIHTRP